MLRKKYPEARIIFAADNDRWSPGNPGLKAALTAAHAVHGLVASPTFTVGCQNDACKKDCGGQHPTDFNDLEGLEGLKVVVRCLDAACHPDEPGERSEQPRSFEDLLMAATALTRNIDLDEVERIVAEAIHLNPVRRSQIYRALKESTGLTLGTIKQQAAVAVHAENGDDPDHLALARLVQSAAGVENLVGTEGGHVWRWEERGVWRPLESRAIKKIVQATLEEVEGPEVTKHLVDSVADVFVTDVYRPGHSFDVGQSDVVNVLNGELHPVDLGGWELRPHDRDSHRTTQLPLAWDAEAVAPRFIQFLGEVLHGDDDEKEKIQSVLEVIGYTLMAHSRYEWFIVLVGPGSNGKSVLLFVLEALLSPENVAAV